MRRDIDRAPQSENLHVQNRAKDKGWQLRGMWGGRLRSEILIRLSLGGSGKPGNLTKIASQGQFTVSGALSGGHNRKLKSRF